MLPVCLIVALPAEARPLISYFGLSGVNHPSLRLYKGDQGYLLQTGVGKLNACANTAAMLASLPDVSALINVGIAGGEYELGETLVAHSIQDQASKQQWYPHLPSVRKLAGIHSTKVNTVDTPCDDYTNDCVYDMEASGIFAAAAKSLDLAFVHSIKVISDNSANDINAINAESVEQHMQTTVSTIETVIKALPFDTLPETKAVKQLCAKLSENIHYTATESHTLKQLLHRHNALIGSLPSCESLLAFDNAKKIRTSLLTTINESHITY